MKIEPIIVDMDKIDFSVRCNNCRWLSNWERVKNGYSYIGARYSDQHHKGHKKYCEKHKENVGILYSCDSFEDKQVVNKGW